MFKKTSITLISFALFSMAVFSADEVNVRVSIRFVPDNIERDTGTIKFDVTGELTTSAGRQIINTGAWETVTISADISTNGWAFFENTQTDSDTFIEIATATGTNVFMKLLANEFSILPLSNTGLIARTTTTGTNVTSAILNKIIINR